MGMTAEQYWYGDTSYYKFYRQAYRTRLENEQKIRAREADRDAWWNGVYLRKALQSIYLLVNGFVPKGVHIEPYPEKPLLEQQEEDQKKEVQEKKMEDKMQLSMALFQAMAESFNKGLTAKQEQGDAVKT